MTTVHTTADVEEEPPTLERRAAKDVVDTIVQHGKITQVQLEAVLQKYGLSSDPHSDRSIVRDLVNLTCPPHCRQATRDVIMFLCGDRRRLTSEGSDASLAGNGTDSHPPQAGLHAEETLRKGA